jgi:hypothetical protein
VTDSQVLASLLLILAFLSSHIYLRPYKWNAVNLLDGVAYVSELLMLLSVQRSIDASRNSNDVLMEQIVFDLMAFSGFAAFMLLLLLLVADSALYDGMYWQRFEDSKLVSTITDGVRERLAALREGLRLWCVCACCRRRPETEIERLLRVAAIAAAAAAEASVPGAAGKFGGVGGTGGAGGIGVRAKLERMLSTDLRAYCDRRGIAAEEDASAKVLAQRILDAQPWADHAASQGRRGRAAASGSSAARDHHSYFVAINPMQLQRKAAASRALNAIRSQANAVKAEMSAASAEERAARAAQEVERLGHDREKLEREAERLSKLAAEAEQDAAEKATDAADKDAKIASLEEEQARVKAQYEADLSAQARAVANQRPHLFVRGGDGEEFVNGGGGSGEDGVGGGVSSGGGGESGNGGGISLVGFSPRPVGVAFDLSATSASATENERLKAKAAELAATELKLARMRLNHARLEREAAAAKHASDEMSERRVVALRAAEVERQKEAAAARRRDDAKVAASLRGALSVHVPGGAEESDEDRSEDEDDDDGGRGSGKGGGKGGGNAVISEDFFASRMRGARTGAGAAGSRGGGAAWRR